MMQRRPAPEVTVEQGTLRGRWKARGNVAVFRGVPFAAPPVGDLRWKPPMPAEPWTGTRDAAKDGPTAIQRGADIHAFIGAIVDGHGFNPLRAGATKALLNHAPVPKASEDCLYLTVRTPDPAAGAGLPVMVWIHGGDHQDGSGIDPYYVANTLAQQGVVTVSINYRLGLFGNFAHPELVAESPHGSAGTYGTLDQIAALEWVQQNIAAFGGNPDNVTIFGESAGGESVLHLMTSPLARGLFHRAIPQSPANGGQMIHLDRPFLAWESAQTMGETFAREIGVSGANQLHRLRDIPAEEINRLSIQLGPGGGFYPAIDGHVIPKSPLAAFAAGEQAMVPMVIGSNADEGSALAGSVFHGAMAEYRHLSIPAEGLQPEIADAFGDDLGDLLALYPGLDQRDPGAEADFVGDHLFGGRAYWYASNHQRAGAPTWFYFFSRVPPSDQQTVGAFHAAELVFVHGSKVPIFPMTREDQALSKTMIGHWTQMARRGDPNPADPAGVAWPGFDATDPQWMNFNHDVRMEPVQRLDKYRILNARTQALVDEMSAVRATMNG